jgi:ribonuclease T
VIQFSAILRVLYSEEYDLPLKQRQKLKNLPIASRFRGFLPVVVDVETSGLNPATDALLEIAIVPLMLDKGGLLFPLETEGYHVEPFQGATFNAESLALTGIDPSHPFRFAIPEQQALHNIFLRVSSLVEESGCQRAVLVGHNAWFDLAFIQAAVKRCHLRSVPFHSFTSLDTATLSAVALGETVLARALRAAKIPFDVNQAHSAIYDAEKTAALFCYIVNQWNL